jgi:predicted nucleic acid-binding Zn ribbon protein
VSRRTPWRRDEGPQAVSQSMARVLGRLGGSPSLSTMELVFTRWTEVVGEEFDQHLRPVRIDGSVLVIGADHAAWATRARIDSAQILTRVRALGDVTIERIEVTVQRP